MQWEQWIRIVPLRIRSLLQRRRMERELQEELQFHIEQKTLELVAAGFVPAEARRAAILAIGELEQCKEECRDARGVRLVEETWQDIRAGVRLLWRTRGFTLLAIAMLAISLAANAIVLAFTSALLLKPLPYGTPEGKLLLIWNEFASQHLERIPLSAAEVSDLQKAAPHMAEAAAFRYTEFNLVGGEEPERVRAAAVSWNLLSVLGTAPILGRSFATEDQFEATPSVVLIAEQLWKRRFASDPAIVGREILLSGRPYLVIGVMPAAFQFPPALFDVRGPAPGTAEIWKPIKISESGKTDRSPRIYGVVARLHPGALPQALNDDLDALGRFWQRNYPRTYQNRGFAISSHLLRHEIVGRARPAMLVAAAAAFVLFVIAIANVTALLLARADRREQELAVRISLGAGPIRLFRQVATEGLLLAFIGGAAGAALTASGLFFWQRVGNLSIPLLHDLQPDTHVSLSIALSAALVGAIIGGIPAWRMVARARTRGLRADQSILRHARLWERLRDGLVILEIALALVLLSVAGLLVKGSFRLHEVALGFNPHSVLTMEISVPPTRHPTPQSVAEFFSQAAAAISTTPGISAAAFTSVLPLSGTNEDKSFTLEGGGATGSLPDEEFRVVTPNYFETLEIPLLQGRTFTSADSETAPRVVIVNEALAHRYWLGGDALGKRIKLNAPADAPWMEIIGIVGNVRHKGLDVPASPEFYVPQTQMPARLMTLVARTNGPVAETAAAIRDRIRALNPEQAISNVRKMEHVIADSISHRRLAVLLVTLFALVSLFFATAGVYGVLANIFLGRRRELAMRIALGAQRGAILQLVFRRSLFLVVIGVTLGLPLALLANHALGSLRHDVTAYDPVALLCALTLLAASSFVATFIPAKRAAAVDAIQLLRCD